MQLLHSIGISQFIDKCRRSCRNGGFCVGPDKCTCLPGFSGKWCHKGTESHIFIVNMGVFLFKFYNITF